MVAELASWFELTPEQTGLIAAESLLPNKLHLLTHQNIKDLLGYYSKFLNADKNLEAEIKKWKVIHQDQGLNENFPKDAVAALQACEQESFPALHRVFTILLTTPVGSVACERSFSALRRLKLWTRSTMSEDKTKWSGFDAGQPKHLVDSRSIGNL